MEYAHGTVLDNYKLLARVGAGSCGMVWQAENIVSGELAALKILSGGDLAERELRALRLYREINHPALIRIRHIGRAGETFFYTMDWCEASLAERRVSAKELLDIAKVLTEGLSVLHAQGLLHRDIKPANIFFRQGAPVLGDIGLLTRQEGATLAGTPGFLAPQLLSGKGSADCYSDCYALAKSLYCALSGLGPEQFPLYTGEMSAEASLLMRAVIAVCSEPPVFRTADGFLHFLKNPAPAKRNRSVWLRLSPLLLAALCAAGFFLMRTPEKSSPAPGPEIEKTKEKRSMPESRPETDIAPSPPVTPSATPTVTPTVTPPVTPTVTPSATPTAAIAIVPASEASSSRPVPKKTGKPDRNDPEREEIEKRFTSLPPEAEAKRRSLEQTAEVFRLLGSSGRLQITEKEEKALLAKLTPEQGEIWRNCGMALQAMQSSSKWKRVAEKWRWKEMELKSQIRELQTERKLDAPAALRQVSEKEPLLAFWYCQAECLHTLEELIRAAKEKTQPDLSPLLDSFSAKTMECWRRFSLLGPRDQYR